jgi:hypothetical protein
MRISLMLILIATVAGCASKDKSAQAKKDGGGTTKAVASTESFQDKFDVDKADLSSRGVSKYMILQPGRRAEYQSKDGKLIITVLPETKTVDGVETAVVEERESEKGKLTEVSRNFFALNPKTGDVYYFGEEVDEYKDGKVAGHKGAWISGVNGAHFGMMIPGQPRAGQRFQSEVAPKVAMDRCEVKDTNAKVSTPLLGTFSGCLKIDETTPLEKGISHKVYAPNVGLIEDDEMMLVRVEGGGGK